MRIDGINLGNIEAKGEPIDINLKYTIIKNKKYICNLFLESKKLTKALKKQNSYEKVIK